MVLDMVRVPLVRFQRVAAAFDADVARVRLCESSGSEHSPESFTDLSDLVKSFMEKDEVTASGEEKEEEENCEKGDEEELEDFGSEKRETLRGLLYGDAGDDGEDEKDAKEKIRKEVEDACGFLEDKLFPGSFKRRLMHRLREKGFDAGLCKSKWEKKGRLTAGDYEYIDVNFSGKRYIIEVSLAAEFEIARPTDQYSSLLDGFPSIFVGKVEELKHVVRLMCTAIKGSMKRMELHIPPWRRNVYMQAKWFSAYKRTTNAVSTSKGALPLSSSDEPLFPKRSIGFEVRALKAHNCRGDYASNNGFRSGHLTAAFNSENF